MEEPSRKRRGDSSGRSRQQPSDPPSRYRPSTSWAELRPTPGQQEACNGMNPVDHCFEYKPVVVVDALHARTSEDYTIEL